MKTRTAHVIALADRPRITCDLCDSPAVMAEHAPHAGGVSFFHYCGDCWHKPAANGGPSACERTGADLDDRDDFERRWLAECRAHGDAKRALDAAHDLLLECLECVERRPLVRAIQDHLATHDRNPPEGE